MANEIPINLNANQGLNQVPPNDRTQNADGTNSESYVAPLFEDSVSPAAQDESFDVSAAGANDSPEVLALKVELQNKETEIQGIDASLADNALKMSEATTNILTLTNTASVLSGQAQETNKLYAIVANELDETQSHASGSSLFKKSDMQQLNGKVDTLKQQARSVQEEYEKIQEQIKAAQEEIKNLQNERNELSSQRQAKAQEADAIKSKIQELQPKPQNEKTNKSTSSDTANKAQTPSAAQQNSDTKGASNLSSSAPTQGIQDETINQIIEDSNKVIENYDNWFFDFVHEDVKDYLSKIMETSGGLFTIGDFDAVDADALELSSAISDMIESKMNEQVYTKSSAMAKTDTASNQEHSSAETDFTEAVLNVSDIVNTGNLEFSNITDQSNYELGQHMLERINDGEYIKTSDLEKTTSSVKNIQFVEKDDNEIGKTKYEEFSDAILKQLQDLSEDKFSENKPDKDEYTKIESHYNMLKTTDVENAFKYLKEEAAKYNLTKINEE